MEQIPTSQITFAFGKISFHQPEMKNAILRQQHSSYSKEYLHNFVFNLHKKWNADQHAILKRPLIISLFSNSCQEQPMCP